MARTLYRICLEDIEFTDGAKVQQLRAGRRYLTTPERNGDLTVLTSPFWVHGAPATLFAGESIEVCTER